MAEKLPPEMSDSESFKAMCGQVESLLDSNQSEASESNSLLPDLVSVLQNLPSKTYLASDSINRRYHKMEDQGDADTSPSISGISQESNGPQEGPEGVSRSPRIGKLEGKKEVIEQFEPGVYATVVDLGNGNKIFKRVRFRYPGISFSALQCFCLLTSLIKFMKLLRSTCTDTLPLIYLLRT